MTHIFLITCAVLAMTFLEDSQWRWTAYFILLELAYLAIKLS